MLQFQAFGIKEKGPILSNSLRRNFDKIRKAAEIPISDWPKNAMRHTAGSMHFAMFQDAAKTCALLGHRSDETLFTHYRALVSKSQAEEFYNIKPTLSNKKIIQLKTAELHTS